MQNKKDFKYAALYQPGTEKYLTDCSEPGLTLGPETARRAAANDGVAVTICCITYNHEEFIAQALDSFLAQKTNFRFQIFVGEDHGPDGTADIVRQYAEQYPDIIVPFLREQNMGAQRNLIDLCQHANSPYIAFCEGDDYWVDEYKLQKQFDCMQENATLRMCFTRTRIEASEDWYLRSHYRANRHGELIIPDCIPGFKMPRRFLRACDLVTYIPLHTSTHFYRWNYDLELPEWYYEGVEGAFPLLMMQMGLGEAAFLPDVTSVYRRSDVGVLMNTSTDEHFLNTRLDYIRFIWNLRCYFMDHYGSYCRIQLENRIKMEGYNFLSRAVKAQDDAAIQSFFLQYPEASRVALNAYLSFFHDSRLLVRVCSWEGYRIIVRRKCYRAFLAPYSVLAKFVAHMLDGARRILKLGRRALAPLHYWKNTLVKKRKNLWVVAGFRGNSYIDNTKYFYDYVLEHHPEIDVQFLTKNKGVYQRLKKEGKPVCLDGTREYRRALSHAQIAVIDHFCSTDFNPCQGFNDRTKVVQLWHGVGFKSMGDASGVKNTADRSVRHSNDILPVPGDGWFTKLVKKLKYFILAPFRERFEKYFLFVCPGQERLDMIADVWHVPRDRCFMAGHPRDLPMYTTVRQTTPLKVMYAPTYRFNYPRERAMVRECLDVLPAIQALMEKVNGEFYLRLHPHTWRNYRGMIDAAMKPYDRVFLHSEKDVYKELGSFSVVISDYSSIALDFALLDRPVIFHGADYDWFVKNEAGFNLDFPAVIPGPMTRSWEETLQRVEEYCADPAKDADLRRDKLTYFFDRSVNGPDNSERIVQEIKRRIGLA